MLKFGFVCVHPQIHLHMCICAYSYVHIHWMVTLLIQGRFIWESKNSISNELFEIGIKVLDQLCDISLLHYTFQTDLRPAEKFCFVAVP